MKSDKMFVSEKKLADLLIKISTSLSVLGTSESTDLDKYVYNFSDRFLVAESCPSVLLYARVTFGVSVNEYPSLPNMNLYNKLYGGKKP